MPAASIFHGGSQPAFAVEAGGGAADEARGRDVGTMAKGAGGAARRGTDVAAGRSSAETVGG